MLYDLNIREEELKNKIASDFFDRYDCTRIIGNIDFCVSVPDSDKMTSDLFERESLLWAEAKPGKVKDIYELFVQLILTIGKARTFEKELPPAFLGAFDAETIAFLPYNSVLDIFHQNDFNWNIAPSDYSTKEFKQIRRLAEEIISQKSFIFDFKDDDKELRKFIKENFIIGKRSISRINITRNNFVYVYLKWLDNVKPTIAINWAEAKKHGIIDADFYLADLLSEHNITLREKLYVLLRDDKYTLERNIDESGLLDSKSAYFNDKQSAYNQFWNHYNRPPKREYWDYILKRRDLLVPQDVRERKGSFFTPQIWVEKSQEYIADTLGENWQDEYYIWDCAAGTGNLLNGLTNKYNIWASTLDQADVDVMKDRIRNGANLLESHVFKFDFLNDSFDILPEGLRKIVNDPEKRRKLVIYINPPYAEAATKGTISNTGNNKVDVAVTTNTYTKMSAMSLAGRELFAQFIFRIDRELSGATLGVFSKLKILNAPNFKELRNSSSLRLLSLFIVPADTFDNVQGKFPIGFFVWQTANKEKFSSCLATVFDKTGIILCRKEFASHDTTNSINDWLISTRGRVGEIKIGFISCKGNDFQNTNFVFIINNKNQLPHPRGTEITDKNIIECCIYYSVRHCIEPSWLNDRDQFLYPNDQWKSDREFQSDCLAFTLFNTNIQSQNGTNYWIPFTEAEVDAKEKFESHFMTDFISGKDIGGTYQPELGEAENPRSEKIIFSTEAQAVMNAGRELWRYYHSKEDANPNASLYDIREYFQGRKENGRMNSTSSDTQYTVLIGKLRNRLHVLAQKIEPKVYQYGFLLK